LDAFPLAVKLAALRRRNGIVPQELITNIGVANIYESPAFRSQVISQSWIGETLKVLAEEPGWFQIEMEDHYQGWINDGQAVKSPSDWNKREQYATADLVTFLYDDPDTNATTIRDMVMGSKLPLISHRDGWVELLLPDGNQGWVPDHPFQYPGQTDVEQLLATAFKFQGIPYFWGGRSPKGFDCSGFAQTVFRLNGIMLPRDAWQQAEVGNNVAGDWHTWQPGDLIFFSEKGDRITHVGLSLGEGDFIHSSGFVKLNSVNPNHPELYSQRLTDIFLKTQRVV